MCPFCISTLGFIVAGAVSTGGLATFALKVARNKNRSTENTSNSSNERSSQNVD
jgi:hypothetical protein